MKNILLIIAIVFCIQVSGQTIENGKIVEFYLPSEDCHSGSFYIGKFTVGYYEISANIAGYDANDCGWKILIGRNWNRSPLFNEVFNIIGGSFYYISDEPNSFHLWWNSEYKNISKPWRPHIKVEFQNGSFNLDSEEPELIGISKLESLVNQRTSTIQMTGLKVSGLINANEIRVEEIAANDLKLRGSLAANNIIYTPKGQTADFVFDEDYNLLDLNEVESFIKENKHLPEIPSAEEMEASGVNMAEMNKLLLQKIEELTLYLIEKQDEIERLQNKESLTEERLEQIELVLNALINESK